MAQLNLNYNPQKKINFEGEDLLADRGIRAISNFTHVLNYDKGLAGSFFLRGDSKKRIHIFH